MALEEGDEVLGKDDQPLAPLDVIYERLEKMGLLGLAEKHDVEILAQVRDDVVRAVPEGHSVILEICLRALDGVNAMILDLHGYLLQRDEYAGRWLDYREMYPAYNRDRVGRSTGEVAYNENKARSWLRVMSYVGLIQPERSNSFVLAPHLDRVRELLAAAQAELAEGLS